MTPAVQSPAHTISVVIPVYSGAKHLPRLLTEIAEYTDQRTSPDGHAYRVAEVILVHDCGPDDSDRVIRELADRYTWIKPVWLSRNVGQHPATIAGMASSFGEWIVTMDEDGQHDPADIASLLDGAMSNNAQLVYARPLNPPPHSLFRNLTSRFAKSALNVLTTGSTDASVFHSFRLILGEVGRSVAAYTGHGVYLDVALSWVARPAVTAPATMRDEGERKSGYRPRTLLSHFWRMVITAGTRGLRLVSVLGLVLSALGLIAALFLTIARLSGGDTPEGWTSLAVLLLMMGGLTLFSLGIIAEYIGVAVNMAMGKPPYLITSDPGTGPLGRKPDGG